MSLLGILGAALIICYLAFMGFKVYFKGPELPISPQAKEAAQEQKINTSSYQSTLKDIRSQIDAASQKDADRVKELENLK